MVVFTTAYDEYALKAFDYNCVDYLLKPVSFDALQRALTKCETFQPRADKSIIKETSAAILNHNVKYRSRVFLEVGR